MKITRKSIVAAVALACGVAPLYAATLTPAEALSRLNAMPRKAAPADMTASPVLAHTARATDGTPALYVFTPAAGKGYMIVSADDVARPLLGYSSVGSFDAAQQAPAMRWWLEEYTRQIEYAAAKGLPYKENTVPEGRHAIEPMIKTAWDQGEPYNQLCPIVNGARSYTGCVATSMAQIMNYWKYPAVGTGVISYNDNDGCGKRLTWDFSAHPFDWDNMLDRYRPGEYTEEQATAVATLMKSAGSSVRMSYAADASGALSMNSALGLVKYFNYDPNLLYTLRSYVSTTEWDRMVYDNLAEVGPVLYGGASMLGGGHSFIIDGYDGEGYYHFNWGWSELSDGYYALDALNPSSLGAGGGTGGGYNFTQDAVFGIQPPTGKPVEERPVRITQNGTLSGTIDGDILKLTLIDEAEPMWVNYTPQTITVAFGVIIERQGGDEPSEPVTATVADPLKLQAGYGAQAKYMGCQVDLATLDLADGTYKVTMATRVVGSDDQQWQPVQPNYGFSNYIILNKTGEAYTVEVLPAVNYTVDSVELLNDLYYGCLLNINVTLTNNSDIEISRGAAPALYYGTTIAFMGEGIMVSLKPGETVTRQIITPLTAMSNQFSQILSETEFYFTLFDETSYRVMSDEIFAKITMYPNPGTPTVTISPRLAIEGSHYVPLGGYYRVNDPADIHVTGGLTLQSGFVGYPLYVLLLSAPDAEGNMEIIDFRGKAAFLSEEGDSAPVDEHFNFSAAVPKTTYYFTLAYGVMGSFVPVSDDMLRFRVADPAGVEDVAGANGLGRYGDSIVGDGFIEVYNLGGICVASGTDNVSIAALAPGIYIARCGSAILRIAR